MNRSVSTSKIQQAFSVWAPVSQILFVPHTEKEYRDTVELMDILIDEVGEDVKHPLASFMEILGVLIEKYEDEYIPEITEL